MTVLRSILTVLLLSGVGLAPQGFALARETAQPQPSLFDPERHMRVSEVSPGMKGYGLSVFQGTEIERFEVEVLAVLRNFKPKYDVILIRCEGANLEHTGSVSGMSGSPIYLFDESGRERIVGAFAYGWALSKDPMGGVQPIEYMLEMPETLEPEQWIGAAGDGAQGTEDAQDTPRPGQRIRWSLEDSVLLPGMEQPPANYPLAGWDSFTPNPRLMSGAHDSMRLRPLATPLMTAGVPAELLEELSPLFAAYGMVPLQAGAGGSAVTGQPPADLAPGSVMAVPLMTGDVEFTAVGTCTEVIGDRAFGFGHPFMNEGPVALPMGSGEISAVVANLSLSFKIGSLTATRGTLYADQTVGVAGRIGQVPTTAPIDLRIIYEDGSFDESYRFDTALHPRFTPLLGAIAFSSAISGARQLPRHHTLIYDLQLDFANGQSLNITNTAVNTRMGMLFFEIATPILAAADNPFEQVMLERMSGTVRVVPEAREARILSANVSKLKYQPGETVTAFVTYRPFRGAESILPVQFELPHDLAEGDYELVISDWHRYLSDERSARPFRFTAETADEVFHVLQELADVRQDALYLRLVRQADGVAVGRTAMPHLPASRRQVLLDAGRSNTTPFVSSTVTTFPTEHVMNGSAEFILTIDKNARALAPAQTGVFTPGREQEATVAIPQLEH